MARLDTNRKKSDTKTDTSSGPRDPWDPIP